MKNLACNSKKQKLSTMIFGLILLLMSYANVSFAKDITLTWDPSPSPETDVVGYKIYYGTSSGIYTGVEAIEGPSPVDSGNTTSKTFVGFDNTKAHYFTVTAYNFNGVESTYTNEVKSPALSNEDSDGDGYDYDIDCDDYNAEINPAATEIPYNGKDENCNGMADDDDLDNDGYTVDADCKDQDSTINPGATEIPYNGKDENCNGMADDDDLDNDGYTKNQGDCNDSNVDIYPGATDVCGDSIDQDCSNGDAVCIDPLELISPKGGEKWSSSSLQTTSWKVSDAPSLVDTVIIEYSRNDHSWKTLKTLSGEHARETSTEVKFPTTRKSKDIKVKVTVKNAQGVVMGKKNSGYLTLTR